MQHSLEATESGRRKHFHILSHVHQVQIHDLYSSFFNISCTHCLELLMKTAWHQQLEHSLLPVAGNNLSFWLIKFVILGNPSSIE